ncbi:hypothetical protein GDO78_019439, partial [Eleutherodactylus coqui]
PSDALVLGKIKNVDCVLLARHGRQHTIAPTNVNFRANIWALKMEGCTHVLVTTACGSLREDIQPGDIVVLDQFIDREVSVDKVLKTLKENANKATSILLTAIPQIAAMDWTDTIQNIKCTVELSIMMPRH